MKAYWCAPLGLVLQFSVSIEPGQKNTAPIALENISSNVDLSLVGVLRVLNERAFRFLGSLRCPLFLQRPQRLLLFLLFLVHAFTHGCRSCAGGLDTLPLRCRFSSLFFFFACSRCFFCCR
jgi:hypothetical protein